MHRIVGGWPGTGCGLAAPATKQLISNGLVTVSLFSLSFPQSTPSQTLPMTLSSFLEFCRLRLDAAAAPSSQECLCCHLPRDSSSRGWDVSCAISDFRLAAELGCHRCSLLAKCITCYDSDILARDGSLDGTWDFWFDLTLDGVGDNPDENLQLDVFSPGSEPRKRVGSNKVRHLLPGDTSSETTFDTIRGWMTECLSNHPDCPKSHIGNGRHTPPLPRRLLEVANGKVVLREDLTQKTHPYACLSHCWGPSPRRPESTILKAKRATIEQLKIEVPWGQLTKTFQDAIDICRRLGIDFLWIDSLCILQDSEDDWSLNATEVGSIYENALITIAASKSKEGCEGCYSLTGPRHLARLVDGSNDVFVRLKPPSYPVHEVHLDLENFPLLDRAWVYQEMHLSVRVLHFCSQEVMWSCRRMRRSESGVSDEDATDDFVHLSDLHGWDPSWKTLGKNGHEDPRALWYRTVEEYTRLHISYPSDIFPALAALTQRMYRLRQQDMLLAGLWKDTLLLDLMWQTPAGPQFVRPAKWRAPSWSWASVQAKVAWDLRLGSIFGAVELLGVHCETKGPPELGNFSSTPDEVRIAVRAPVLKATWKKPWVRSRWPEITRTVEMKDGKIDVNRYYPDYDYDVPGEHHIPWDSKVFIVPIAISTLIPDEADSDGPNNNLHLALVLRAKEGGGTYNRIGYVEIAEDHVVEDWSREAFQARFGRVDAMLRAIPRQNITIV